MHLLFQIDLCIAGVDPQPWSACREARSGGGAPLEGRAGVVAAVPADCR